MTIKPPRVRRFIAPAEPLSIVDVMSNPKLFGVFFQGGESWNAWKAVLKATFGLPMSDEEREFFRTVAEREPPKHQVKEAWFVVGRGGGKDSVASVIAAYSAAFCQLRIDRLRPGETALVQCLACDRDQARIVLNYTRSYFEHCPPLREMIVRQTERGLLLANDVEIVVATNSYRSVRGRSILVSIFDEVAFWQDDRSARPDTETYRAVLPGLARVPGSLLVGISSPYRKSGLLHERFKNYYGVDDPDVLVIKAPSLTMNPTLDAAIVAKALEDDPAAARAEWLAEFRDDIAAFVDPDAVAACIVAGRRELPPVRGTRYVGFVDPSGGSADSMTLGIAHVEAGKAVLDLVREVRPPFSPDSVTSEFAGVISSYSCAAVYADRYGGDWPAERFRAHGIRIEPSERNRSEIYIEMLPLLNSGLCELLDLPRLVSQLCGLERRTSRIGKDSIDHGPGAHDDVINAAAGAMVAALSHRGMPMSREQMEQVIIKLRAMPPRWKQPTPMPARFRGFSI